MPSNYAHYRFGSQVLPTLPADVRRPIQRFRRLYDMGLHGPDLFFYHSFFPKDTVVSLGKKYHHMNGREYFNKVCKRLKMEPTEAGMAYLYGILAHYCLDSVFHPFVLQATANDLISHTELETEFDRYLLTLDGKERPHTYDCSSHIQLTRGECVTVSEFYAPATADHVLHSVNSMARTVKALASDSSGKRRMVKRVLKLAAPPIRDLMMPPIPNRSCAHLNESMLALYDQAVERYALLMDQLVTHMTYNAPFGPDFEHTFDGTGAPESENVNSTIE